MKNIYDNFIYKHFACYFKENPKYFNISIKFSWHIIINEDLTKYRDRLLYLCRQLCRERKLKQAWTSNGKISVRDFGDRTYAIRKESDLAPFGHVLKESGHS